MPECTKAPLDQQVWHVEGPGARVITAENGEAIGMMDTGNLAAVAVQDHNRRVYQQAPVSLPGWRG